MRAILIACATALALITCGASAQTFPTKPITLGSVIA